MGQVFSSPALQSVQLGGYIGAVKVLMPFLLTYAVAFNAIPVIRAIWNKVENKKIAKRNQTRRLWRAMLEGEGGNVRRKLRAAKVRWGQGRRGGWAGRSEGAKERKSEAMT